MSYEVERCDPTNELYTTHEYWWQACKHARELRQQGHRPRIHGTNDMIPRCKPWTQGEFIVIWADSVKRERVNPETGMKRIAAILAR